VLIVEDDPGIRALLRVVLEVRGHTVHEAASGDVALEAARAAQPDVVTLDIGLPGLDGIGVLRALKEDAGLRDVPVLMVTAWDDQSLMDQALGLGAVDYVRKPFDPDALVARVEAFAGAGS
jgi:DNA-binding response OmpR family regulator